MIIWDYLLSVMGLSVNSNYMCKYVDFGDREDSQNFNHYNMNVKAMAS